MIRIKYIFFCVVSILLLFSCSSNHVEEDIANTDPITEEPDIIDHYEQGNPDDIIGDVQITPTKAKDNQHQTGTDIGMTIDGNRDTHYHSPWGSDTEFPVVLEYFFKDVKAIDYMILYPRNDNSTNGRFGKVTIYIKNNLDEEYRKFKKFDFKESSEVRRIVFEKSFENPTAIKLEVDSGANDFVSLGEIEFYKNAPSISSYLSIFEDKAASKIKQGITGKDIDTISNEFIKKMAQAIYEGVYDEFRVEDFRSYPDPSVIAKENRTNTYGFYDNATGIFVRWGTEMIVFVDDFEGNIGLKVVNHEQGFEGKDYVLKPGLNKFTVNTEGLAYIIYQDDHERQVKVNFATGEINGYWDKKKHSKADFEEFIGNAPYSYFDVLGDKAMLTFTTKAFQSYTDDINKLIDLYDDMVYLEDKFMGLYTYNRIPQTRAYFRANVSDPNMYMYSTAFHTEHNVSTMNMLANPANLENDPWGAAHELGHTHQTFGLKWAGMTEVTVNIFSNYVLTQWGNRSHMDNGTVDKSGISFGSYNNEYEKGFTEAIDSKAHSDIDDLFVQLIPFWQLQLYFSDVKGYSEFYEDLHEYLRTHSVPDDDGQQQIDFVRIASQISELDLTEFFESWGFLKQEDKTIDDYGKHKFKITQSMIDKVKQDMSQFNKPEESIKYINEYNVDVYKRAEPVKAGTATVSVGGEVSVIGSDNVVAYEQVREDKVIYVGVRDSFVVNTYEDGDKIYAIGYDGNREEVIIE